MKKKKGLFSILGMVTLLKRSALAVAGIAAVTGLSVLNSSGVFICVVINGAFSVNRSLSSIAVGKEDACGLENIMKSSLRISLPINMLIAVLYAVFSSLWLIYLTYFLASFISIIVMFIISCFKNRHLPYNLLDLLWLGLSLPLTKEGGLRSLYAAERMQ